MKDMRMLQQAVDSVEKHGSIAEAARQLKIPRKTLSNRYSKAKSMGVVSGMPMLDDEQSVIIDSKWKKLSSDKRLLQRKYDHLLESIESKDRSIEAMQKFDEQVKNVKPIEIKASENKKISESTAVVLCSDLHYEETVDPNTIDHLNEYNTTIARTRFKKFINNSIKLVDMCRGKSIIDNLVFWIGGDMINGYIHEEFIEENAMSPVDASTEVFELLVSGIDFLLAHGNFKKIIIPTNVGNHSRTTEKRRVATLVQNNYEWLIYKFLDTYYKDNDRIQFKLTRGYFNYLDVYGYTLRFHHGDHVRYGGGVGGLTVPLNKAIAMWNQAKPAYLDVLGHWHQRFSSKNCIVNSSIIGYNAYAQSIKASFEQPQQTFFLMHPRHGKTVEAPIFVE